MSEVLPWLVGAVVLVAVAWALLMVYGRRDREKEDPYPRALEAWLAGDLERAEDLLRQAVRLAPDSIEPFLHLGDLLRQRGDAERAAVLHRGLTVRPDLPRRRRVDIGLALADDLLALERWDEAGQTLDTVATEAQLRPRYWWARFRQQEGAGNRPDAARALKRSLKKVPQADRAELEAGYIAFQLDRALEYALAGDEASMSPRLRDVTRFPAAEARAALVRAMAAAVQGDPAAALRESSDHLLEHPTELAVLLPYLQSALLESGQYARTVPLLENACNADGAPASLAIDLALLYEKLGRRDDTLRLLAARSGDPGITPDVAAPLLKLLFRDAPPSDLRAVWGHLGRPRRRTHFVCSSCGAPSQRMRWFCPECRDFDSYESRLLEEGKTP